MRIWTLSNCLGLNRKQFLKPKNVFTTEKNSITINVKKFGVEDENLTPIIFWDSCYIKPSPPLKYNMAVLNVLLKWGTKFETTIENCFWNKNCVTTTEKNFQNRFFSSKPKTKISRSIFRNLGSNMKIWHPLFLGRAVK